MAKKAGSDVVTVEWSGSAGIENAQSLKDSLLKVLKKASHIELDLSKVEEIDITGIQIIMAARKEALQQQKVFFIKEDIPADVVEFSASFGLPLDKLNETGGSNA